ncbi:olfactory receptor 6N2-like [Gastrophryne carolinensis]
MFTNQINVTRFDDFILLGFVNLEKYKLFLLILFFMTYLLTLLGNLMIILVVTRHINLHKPMYFFITNLSCLDIFYASTTTPNLLMMMITNNKRISFRACFTQLYMFHSLGITECNLLAVMAFDRFAAICLPLRYRSIMNTKLCIAFASLSWIIGFLLATIPATLTSQIPFCGTNDINHYFCDIAPIISHVCRGSDITITLIINRFVGGITSMFNLGFVILMYINIIIAISMIKTNKGRWKAFSTCSSHLTIVTFFYGCACTVYANPGSHSVNYDKMVALIYAMFTPFLNPIIYSLRNQEVISGVKREIQSLKKP